MTGWKIDASRRHDLTYIVARRRWLEEPLDVFRIAGSSLTDSGRVEFVVTSPTAEEERAILAAVSGRGVSYGAFRYASS